MSCCGTIGAEAEEGVPFLFSHPLIANQSIGGRGLCVTILTRPAVFVYTMYVVVVVWVWATKETIYTSVICQLGGTQKKKERER